MTACMLGADEGPAELQPEADDGRRGSGPRLLHIGLHHLRHRGLLPVLRTPRRGRPQVVHPGGPGSCPRPIPREQD